MSELDQLESLEADYASLSCNDTNHDAENYTRKRIRIPWHLRIWVAVLRRACVDRVLYSSHSKTRLKKIGEDAVEWIDTDGEEAEKLVNSFVSVCWHLGLDPAVVREKAANLSEEDARQQRGIDLNDWD